ncbi:MAG: phosphoenolpyruvate carboxykinase, partial [Actinobacteria bacterium]|nr:phosphoenolpyruvate carboxykinase [Actinomycetota bacterium]
MRNYSYTISEKKVIITIYKRLCETSEELIDSELFIKILNRCIKNLSRRNSSLINIFGSKIIDKNQTTILLNTLKYLLKLPISTVPQVLKESEIFLNDINLFNDFIEYLYNYWRSFDRFVVCNSELDSLDKRPYRTFNETIEKLTHLVRSTYRSIQKNITGVRPRVYRQVSAGSEIASIVTPEAITYNQKPYNKLNELPVIRQILMYPPLVLKKPMNKRTGQFIKVDKNPLELINIKKGGWLCYPAKVGKLLIAVYFANNFFELGFSLCNLFEIADDKDLEKKPDAVYLFGAPGDSLDCFGNLPTIFYDDDKNNQIIAAVPARNEFGYFGYLKKMVLTLHNIKVMKNNCMPFHGALLQINLKDKKESTILIIGDTGAGKSESLEALRVIGEDLISDMNIIADDMGSIELENGNPVSYGSEIGAFLRLDDLQPGYAFGQIDRAIIMSASQINARIVIPVNSFHNIIKGYKIDYVLYANNYEEIDEDHPIIEKFTSVSEALKVFQEGMVMSKGTTTSTGLTHSYFANIFGPPQYKKLHDEIAKNYFDTFFKEGIFVGQIR